MTQILTDAARTEAPPRGFQANGWGIDPVRARQAEKAEGQNRKTFKDAADGWNERINRRPRADKTRMRLAASRLTRSGPSQSPRMLR